MRFSSNAPLRRFASCIAIAFAAAGLAGCNAVLLSPSGDVAVQQRNLIAASTGLMLLIIVPVITLTLVFAWRYRHSNKDAAYDPDWDHSTQLELVIWAAPLLIVIALGALTWLSTHLLDPYRPLGRIDADRKVPADAKPLVIEVVALDWKWLFLYPEQGIATLNEAAAPVDRPIQFKITSSSVMNSFFVPAVAGQIYAMPGMETKLHAVVNRAGDFEGLSSNYSGRGFSGMRFTFKGLDDAGFDRWVQSARAAAPAVGGEAKAGGGELTRDAYLALEAPSEREPARRWQRVAPGLYDAILNRCVDGKRMCAKDMMAIDARGGLGQPGGLNVSLASPARPGATPRLYVNAMCTAADPIGSASAAVALAPLTPSTPRTPLATP